MTDKERIAALKSVLQQIVGNVPETIDTPPGSTGGLTLGQMTFLLYVSRKLAVLTLEGINDESGGVS